MPCSVEGCDRVGRVKRGMRYRCYQRYLPSLPKLTNVTATGKICRGCELDKPLSEYTKTNRNSSGYHARCRTCTSAQQKQWREANPGKNAEYGRRWAERNPDYKKDEKFSSLEYRQQNYLKNGRNRALKLKYGITVDEFNVMLASQGGRCAICGRPDSGKLDSGMNVDHSHESGKVRGILCHYCNVGLGNFQDNPEILLSAADYLLRHVDVLLIA